VLSGNLGNWKEAAKFRWGFRLQGKAILIPCYPKIKFIDEKK